MGIVKFVRKRDGRIVPFEKDKITNAIFYAAKAVGGNKYEEAEKITRLVTAALEAIFGEHRTPTVEEVQDLVEKMLIEDRHAKTAKAYILYREQRAKVRDFNKLIDEAISLIDNYIRQDDWRVNENSNMSYSLQGLNNYISSSITAKYWLKKIYPQEIRDAHEQAYLHIHDLGILSVYCCGWDLEDLLKRGLGGVSGKIESKPPKHFRTALGQIVNFFYTLQGEAAGAQAFSNFDTLLAPFIKYDNLSYDEVKQSMQEFIFNLNVPTRVGFQTPFTNLTFDIYPPKTLAEEKVTVGGEKQKERYKDFQKEMFMINRAFAEVMLEGDAKGRIFSFPIPTYNITKNFNWDEQEIDKIWEMTAKYGIPYFSNFVNSDMDPDDARSMCCRLRLDNREIRNRTLLTANILTPAGENSSNIEEHSTSEVEQPDKRGGGLFGANPMTGSIGVVTLNMPRLAYISENEENFFIQIEKYMEIAKTSLEIKRKILDKYTDENLYPYSSVYLADIKRNYGTYWANHFSTIGLVGMHEACINLLGTGIETKTGRAFAEKVLNFMKDKLAQFKSETGHLYNLEASPAEGASYRLARADKKDFDSIIASGTDEPYYTNSTQLPVGFTEDLFEALEHQDTLQTVYTGGTVFHGFLGEKLESIESTKNLVKKIADNFHLPYYTITPTFSICPVHGYIPGEYEFCPYPHSDEELEKYGLVTSNS